MHMAFLSRVFKNLQWYGMTKVMEFRWFYLISSLFYASNMRAVCEIFVYCSSIAH